MNRNELFDKNQALVHHVYNTCFKHKLSSHLRNNNEDDFIQEGYMALWTACEKFDPNKGVEFSTYAYTCIKCEMTELLMKLTNNGRFTKSVDVTCSLDDATNGIWKQHELTPAPEREDISWIWESNVLSELEQKIMRKRYEGYTMREIGEQLGYSGAYIHKKYKSAIEKLKRLSEREL